MNDKKIVLKFKKPIEMEFYLTTDCEVESVCLTREQIKKFLEFVNVKECKYCSHANDSELVCLRCDENNSEFIPSDLFVSEINEFLEMK